MSGRTWRTSQAWTRCEACARAAYELNLLHLCWCWWCLDVVNSIRVKLWATEGGSSVLICVGQASAVCQAGRAMCVHDVHGCWKHMRN